MRKRDEDAGEVEAFLFLFFFKQHGGINWRHRASDDILSGKCRKNRRPEACFERHAVSGKAHERVWNTSKFLVSDIKNI